MNFLEQYKAAVRVSTPLIAVRTFDASSAIDALKGSYKDVSKIPLVSWDSLNGARPLNQTGKKGLSDLCGSNPQEATVDLKNTLWFSESGWGLTASARDCVLFINNAHLYWTNDPTVIQGIWNLRNVFKANGHTLVLLIAPGSILPKELQNDVLVIDEPLPTREKLKQIVIENHKLHEADVPDGTKLENAVDALVGLPAFGAEQSVSMCISAGKVKVLDMNELWHKKRELIRQTPGLAVYSGNDTLASIGGSEQAKKFYSSLLKGKRKPNVILFIDELGKQFAGTGSQDGTKAEMAGTYQSWAEDNDIIGGALVGIPGVGKSALVKALGGEFGIPVIVFDVAEMQDKHVGESGARLRAAMATIDAIGGGRVLAIATSNEMDNLPLGLRRRFEFAPTFFFDEPTKQEKPAIWAIHMKAYGLDNQKLPNDRGWTGAEIKQCCSKADALGVSLIEAGQWVLPVTISESAGILQMRQKAHNRMFSAAVEGHYQFDEALQASQSEILDIKDSRRIKD